MAQSFIFGGNTGISYDEAQRKRAIADKLRQAATDYMPKNWAEGLNEIAMALSAKKAGKTADSVEAQRSAAADAIMASLMGGGGYSPVAAPQGPAMPGNGGVTASPLDGPQAIAADAMAAIGQGARVGGGSMSTPVGGGPDLAGVSDAAKAAMAKLQATTGQTFDITSGYRDPAHNAAVGGAKHSQHLDGNAFDISTAGMSQPEIEKLIVEARNSGFGGVGIYNGSLHFDVGPQRAWGPSYHSDSVPSWAQNALATGVVGGTPAATPVGGAAPSGGGQGGAPDVGTLMMAMSNPALSPEQRQIVAALLGQAQQQSDPMRQLELQKAQLELAQMQNPAASGGEYGLQPIVTQDADGKYHLFQIAKDGSAPKEIPLPYGWTPQQQYLDTGTGYTPVPKQGVGTGAPIGKDLAGAASDTAVGKAQGEAISSAESIASKMPGLEDTIAKLDKLAEEATYTMAGRTIDWAMKETGMPPRDAAVARADYIATVNNQVLPLLRDTFGAAFTEKEGNTLRETLGDPNASPMEKQAVLRAFIEQKKRDLAAMQTQSGASTPAPAPTGGASNDPLGLR